VGRNIGHGKEAGRALNQDTNAPLNMLRGDFQIGGDTMKLMSGLARCAAVAVLLGFLGLSASGQQDESKKITPLPGAEQSIDDLIGGVKALRKSRDLSRHQEHHFLRLAERADEKFDKGDFSQSLKILGTFQTDLNEELGDGAISQVTFDSLNTLNGTAMALVSGQQKPEPTFGISSVTCMQDSTNPNKVNFTWTVGWMNQPNQITATVTVTALWTTSDGASLSSSAPLPSSNIVAGGPGLAIDHISGSGSVTPPAKPANVGGVQIEVKIINALSGKNKVPVMPDTATTMFCKFGS
jgi:hypothetical protein